MKRKLLILTALIESVTFMYLYTLIQRMKFFKYSTSIGNDVVLGMYILCLMACILSTIIWLKTDVDKVISRFLLIVALLMTVTFFYMNVFRGVGHFHKDSDYGKWWILNSKEEKWTKERVKERRKRIRELLKKEANKEN